MTFSGSIELPVAGSRSLLDLLHLKSLTDETGLLQHAVFSVVNRKEGYCTDDNARALILAVMVEHSALFSGDFSERFAAIYFSFLWDAFNADRQRFRNFLSYSRTWIDDVGSEECHGRSVWALGFILRNSADKGLIGAADRLWRPSIDILPTFQSARAVALSIFGLTEYLFAKKDSHVAELVRSLGVRLAGLYCKNSAPEWCWLEDRLTYFNARLPHALLLAGERLSDRSMIEIGLKTLEWLTAVQKAPDGYFSPIGTNGFWPRNGVRACFDQQPIDAYATISACLTALRITKEKIWASETAIAFNWFLGANHLGAPVYDPVTGGCRDGLHQDRMNENQGAESTLAFLMSVAELERAGMIHVSRSESSNLRS